MKRNKSGKYTIDELLQDDYFISSVLHPSEENKEFWAHLVQEGNVSAEDIEKASLFIQAVQSRKEKLFRKENEILWNKIEIENKKTLKKKIQRLHIAITTAAACIVLLLGVSVYLYYNKHDAGDTDIFAQLKNTPDLGFGSDIRLVLSDKEQVAFEENNTDVKYDDSGEIKVNSRTVKQENKNEPVASQKKKEKEAKPAYNQLIVPKGKHSTLLLSDGTKLWINAGTHVVFPVTFEGDKREIYVDGEIFLDVVRNEACPFIVKTKRMQVEVLGTSFNIKSYNSQDLDDVVLVTGAVSVQTKSGKNAELSPNQRLTYASGGVIDIQTVDVYEYISWKDGLMQYKSEKFSVILQRLSDYYGIPIYWDPELTELACTGKLDLKEDLEKVFNGLIKMIPVKYVKQDESYFFSINP